MRATCAVLVLLVFAAVPTFARAIIVAKTGGDNATIQAGLNAAAPGDTVFVKAGTYAEFVTWPTSGSPSAGSIVLKAFGDGPAVIDGATLTPTDQQADLLLIRNKSYVAVVGMEMCHNVTASATVFNKGIQIEGASRHVLIESCKVHHIETTNTTTNAGANGIGVFGDSGATSVSDIRIDSTEVCSCKTGYSETISIDGNADGFTVSHCHVHDNNNIGILIAGHYGECPNPANDQARHGEICDNLVERCSSGQNPAYAGDYAADGIYCDGGGKSVFERNVVVGCDIGIEAGAELAGAVDDSMVIRDNLVYNCNTGGLFIGGYETGRGWTVYCRVENNTFYLNDTRNSGTGELLVQKAHDNVIRNNIIYANAQKLGLSLAFNATYTYANTVDHNLFFSAVGGNAVDGASLDTHSVTRDPLFVNAAAGNFRLQTGSPAIDACNPAYTPAAGELDLDSHSRAAGAAVDIGAYEYGGAAIRTSGAARATAVAHARAARLVVDVNGCATPRVAIASAEGRDYSLTGQRIPSDHWRASRASGQGSR